MKRAMTFAGRNFKEMLRDPLCYIFCVAMPLALLFVMHFAFYDAQNTFWFSVEILTPGINCFAYAFVMLYLALLVSQDRATSFLTRLYTSPMRPAEFIIGYMLPGFAIGMVQAVLCYLPQRSSALRKTAACRLRLRGFRRRFFCRCRRS